MPFPRVLRVQQMFDGAQILNISEKISHEISKLRLESRLKPGDSVAITAGSRGVANIAAIIKGVADVLQKLGARPFIIPAMGSHGGATADGQRAVLEHYGITERTMGVPVKATMETTQIGETPQGIPVFVDNNALAADHIAVVNRIKPHTDFDGDIESGLTKMMAIGLGKNKGATHYHRANIKYGYYTVITNVGSVVRDKCKILFGLGVLENAYDQTAIIEAIPSDDIEKEEKRLLQIAKSSLARIPFDQGDVLIIDEMGKNISGAGMDTNVIGRTVSQRERGPMKPNFTRIFVRDLTPESYGNAVGVGLADMVTRRLVEKIDYKPTYINAITSTNVEAARIPVTFDSDQEALETAILTSGASSEEACRMIWIKNTLKLDQFIASESLMDEIKKKENLKVLEQLGELRFTEQGNLANLL
jgi:Lactate racemase N-terminal domain